MKQHHILSMILTLCLLFTAAVPGGLASAQEQAAVVYALGDVDGDELINSLDALTVLRYSVGIEQLHDMAKSAADVDCSGSIDSLDALDILKYSVGALPSFGATGLGGTIFHFATPGAEKYFGEGDYGKIWSQKVDDIRAKYGITLLVHSVSAADIYASLLAGTGEYDLVEIPMLNCRNAARQGKLADMSQSLVFNPSVYDGALTKSCTLGGGIYGVATKAMTANPMGLLINEDMVRRYAPNNGAKLQKMFTDKTWTFNAFVALMDEMRENGLNACFASNTNIVGQAIVANAGYEVKFDETGRAVSAICTDEGIEAMVWCKKLLTQGYWNYEADVNAMTRSFVAGQIPMLAFYLHKGDEVAGMVDFDMTIMPFPIGPQKKDYVMCTFDGTVYAVPAQPVKSTNAVAVILGELSGVETQLIAVREQMLNKIYQEKELPLAVYRWALQNTSYDLSTGCFTGAVGGPVDGSILDPSKDPAVVLPGIADLVQSECDNYYGVFYQD